MAEAKRWYLIAYDIREAKRWRKTFQLLEGYGDHLQYSIFRCHLNQRAREKLRWQLEKILTKEDSLLIIGICNRCEEQLPRYNRERAWPKLEEGFRVL